MCRSLCVANNHGCFLWEYHGNITKYDWNITHFDLMLG